MSSLPESLCRESPRRATSSPAEHSAMLSSRRFQALALVLLALSSCTNRSPSPEPKSPTPRPSISAVVATPSPKKTRLPQRDWGPPIAGLYGRYRGLLEREGVTLVEPTAQDYLGPDGAWNGKEVVLSFQHDGTPYQNLDDIPGLSEQFRGKRGQERIGLLTTAWQSYLGRLPAHQEDSSTEP